MSEYAGNEPDTVERDMVANLRAALTTASNTAKEFASFIQRWGSRLPSHPPHQRQEEQGRFEHARKAAHRELEPVTQPDWWERRSHVSVEELPPLYLIAATWEHHDEYAAVVGPFLRSEIEERFGIALPPPPQPRAEIEAPVEVDAMVTDVEQRPGEERQPSGASRGEQNQTTGVDESKSVTGTGEIVSESARHRSEVAAQLEERGVTGEVADAYTYAAADYPMPAHEAVRQQGAPTKGANAAQRGQQRAHTSLIGR